MVRLILSRPGSTEYDEQGRIKGTLSIPLSDEGTRQAANTAAELSDSEIDAVYSSPCESCLESARVIAASRSVKVKVLDGLNNLDHGLWEGRLIEDVKQKQPKVYRQWQENPESVCPPGGEMLEAARDRIQTSLQKLIKKHKDGVIALVAPEPLASLIQSQLSGGDLGDLWQAECRCGGWESLEVEPNALAVK